MNTTQQVFLQPLDTCFFRDGKPFARGEQSGGGISVFPPSPSTVYGALRSVVISARGYDVFVQGKNPDLNAMIGTPQTPTGATFAMQGVFVGDVSGQTLYFPLPRDLTAAKADVKQPTPSFPTYPLSYTCGISSNACLPGTLMNCQNPTLTLEYPPQSFLDQDGLSSYLLQGLQAVTAYRGKTFFETEAKIGIGRERATHLAAEGQLYRLQMLRLHANYGIVASFHGLQLPTPQGMLKLGAEQKGWTYGPGSFTIPATDTAACDDLIAAIDMRKQFKLYLATPAIWQTGWRANWMNLKGDQQEFRVSGEELQVELLAAAVGQPIPIGGWDIAARRPKTMYAATPAGAVYYLRVKQGTGEQIVRLLHARNLSDVGAHEGFGLSLLGTADIPNAPQAEAHA